jgi:hypothetical protein
MEADEPGNQPFGGGSPQPIERGSGTKGKTDFFVTNF